MKYLIVFALILPACEDRTSVSRALDSMGMTNVQWEGYDWAACAEDDDTHTGFSATNPQGKRVRGTVCCGAFFKNCTVRW